MQTSIFRFSRLDAVLVAVAVLQGGLAAAVLFTPPHPALWGLAAVLFGVIIWWNANTISHNHLHNPLFRSRAANRLFSAYLTLMTGVPQTLWRARHLWHHAGEPHGLPKKLHLGRLGFIELALLGGLWLGLLLLSPGRFLGIYLPGFGIGMLLCQLQGYAEHGGQAVTSEPGISYYGRLHNLLWFNDGYHAEHHRYPGAHWALLPGRRLDEASRSALPPLLRPIRQLRVAANRWQAGALVALEKLALRPGWIQRFMLRSHERAVMRLLGAAAPRLLGQPQLRVGIIGGGLFPRTALVLGKLAPQAHLTVLDASAAHVELARAALHNAGIAESRFTLRAERFDALHHIDFDLLVFPLGFAGDRDVLYQPLLPLPPRLIHDWVWRRRVGSSIVISHWLLKRLNFVQS